MPVKSLSKQAMCRGFVVDWGVEYTHTLSRLKYVTAAYVRQQQFPPVEGVSINFFLDPVPLSNSALSCKLYKSAVKTYAIKQGEWAAGTPLHDLSFAWLLCSQLVEPLYSGPSALKGKSAIVLKGKSKNQCINKRHSLRISNNLFGESIKDQGITPKVTEIFVHSMTFKKHRVIETEPTYCILSCQGYTHLLPFWPHHFTFMCSFCLHWKQEQKHFSVSLAEESTGGVNKHKAQFRTSNYWLVLCPNIHSDPAQTETSCNMQYGHFCVHIKAPFSKCHSLNCSYFFANLVGAGRCKQL